MAFYSEWLRNNLKGPHGPIPPKGAEGALGSPLGSHFLSPWVPLPRLVGTRMLRFDRLVEEQVLPERVSWVGGVRASV